MKINARLEKNHIAQLKFLIKNTGLSISDVVKKALNLFYEQQKLVSSASAFEVIKESGFIGAFSGDKNLSSNYKAELSKSWGEKHGHR